MNLENYRTIIKLINLSCDIRELKNFSRYNYSYDLTNTTISALNILLKDIKSDYPLERNLIKFNSFINIINKETDLLYKKKLQAINDKFKIIADRYNSCFIIHGSLGDGNYVKGWSDVDAVCFVPDEIFNKQELLTNFRKSCEGLWELMLDICPFQHHGILFLPKSFTKHYENSLMPKQALKKGCIIDSSDSNELEIFIMSNAGQIETVNSLKLRLKIGEEAIKTRLYKHHGKNGIYLNIDLKNKSDNMYQLFSLMSYLMLVPALTFTSINQSCYKADSFKKIDQTFSKKSVLFVNLLSSIRKDWEENLKFNNNNIPNWIINRLGKNFMQDGNELIKESIEIFRKYQK
jgi:hypothetical protein